MIGTEPTHLVAIVALAASWLAIWILAVVSILHRPAVGGIERGVWVTVAIIFPFVGPLVWFIWGKYRKRPKLHVV